MSHFALPLIDNFIKTETLLRGPLSSNTSFGCLKRDIYDIFDYITWRIDETMTMLAVCKMKIMGLGCVSID